MNDKERIESVFGKVKEIDAYFKVHAKATYFPNFTRIYVPNEPYEKLIPFMEPTKQFPKLKGQTQLNAETDIERSLRRTHKSISDYVLMNVFDTFATFTFKADRQNIEKSKSKMANWLKNSQKRKTKFEYLIVPEFHHDGESIHFHSLLKGFHDYLAPVWNPFKNSQLYQKGRKVFNVPSYQSGFTNAFKIESDDESQLRIGAYLRKYITKDMPVFHNKNRYWKSTGLLKPKTEDNPKPWYENLTPLRQYEVENGTIYDYPILGDDSTL